MSQFRYRGRELSTEDILYIRALIERHPGESRRKLSVRLCEAWQWQQANGALRDMVCRSMLLMLERAGQITLPPVSYVRHNPLIQRARPEAVLIDATPIESRLCNLQPLELEQVRRTAREPLFNSLMEQHHYLGYEQPVGEHLKYLVWAHDRPVACLAWSSAPRHLASREAVQRILMEAVPDSVALRASIVIGARCIARGLIEAFWRKVTATSPSCSAVVPYSMMCRRHHMAIACG